MKSTKNNDELDDLFNQIEQGEEEKNKKAQYGSSEFLKLVKGQTVRGVLLPYTKNPKNTFVTYEKIGFFNKEVGEYVDLGLFPKSKGVRNDPVSKIQWKTFDEARKNGDEAGKKESYKLLPQREEMVNFLVLEDSANAENVGTVKILKYSARLNKDQEPISAIYSKIKEAVFGSKKDRIGNKAFLYKNPVIRPLIIKVKDKGGYNNYDDTSFDDSEEHGYTPEEIKAIYESCYDLEQYVPELKTNEELQQLMDKYWYQTDATKVDEDDLDFDDSEQEEEPAPKKTKVPLKTTVSEKKKTTQKETVKDEIDDMIDDFDDDDIDL